MPRHFETYPTLAGAGWPVMAAGTQYTQGDLNIGVFYIQGVQQCPLKHVLAYNVALLTYLTITIVLHIRCILDVDHYTEVILLENKTFGLPCIVLRHCTLHHTVSRMRGILEI